MGLPLCHNGQDKEHPKVYAENKDNLKDDFPHDCLSQV